MSKHLSRVCFLHSSNSWGPKARPKHLFYKYSFTNNVTCLFADKQIVLSIHSRGFLQIWNDRFLHSAVRMGACNTLKCVQIHEGSRLWLSTSRQPRVTTPPPMSRGGPGGCVALTMYKIIRRPPLSPLHETARRAWQAFKEPPLKTPRGKGHQNNLEELQAHCHPWDSQTEYLNGVLMVLNRMGWGININQGSLIESWPTAGRG